jgi:hypothetical protein
LLARRDRRCRPDVDLRFGCGGFHARRRCALDHIDCLRSRPESLKWLCAALRMYLFLQRKRSRTSRQFFVSTRLANEFP